MLTKLIDVILQFIEDLWPFAYMAPYERGVKVTSLFKWQKIKDLGPGIHPKIPFFTKIEKCSIAKDMAMFNAQYITSKDDEAVVVRACVTFHVSQPRVYLLEINDADGALVDLTMGTVADHLSSLTWEEIVAGEWRTNLTNKLKRRASEFGFKVHRLQFSTLTKTFNIGLIQ